MSCKVILWGVAQPFISDIAICEESLVGYFSVAFERVLAAYL